MATVAVVMLPVMAVDLMVDLVAVPVTRSVMVVAVSAGVAVSVVTWITSFANAGAT